MPAAARPPGHRPAPPEPCDWTSRRASCCLWTPTRPQARRPAGTGASAGDEPRTPANPVGGEQDQDRKRLRGLASPSWASGLLAARGAQASCPPPSDWSPGGSALTRVDARPAREGCRGRRWRDALMAPARKNRACSGDAPFPDRPAPLTRLPSGRRGCGSRPRSRVPPRARGDPAPRTSGANETRRQPELIMPLRNSCRPACSLRSGVEGSLWRSRPCALGEAVWPVLTLPWTFPPSPPPGLRSATTGRCCFIFSQRTVRSPRRARLSSPGTKLDWRGTDPAAGLPS